jgi:hypothetical protein
LSDLDSGPIVLKFRLQPHSLQRINSIGEAWEQDEFEPSVRLGILQRNERKSNLGAYMARVSGRPKVHAALKAEGLAK